MTHEAPDGPLGGLRVVELASEHAAFAAKMLADLGAHVVVVEPPGGHVSRGYGPFVADQPGPERSLWWWHYNTSKRGVVIDIEREPELFERLVHGADIVVEGEPPGRLGELGLDHDVLRGADEQLVWVSVTPFGRRNPRSGEVATDLTVLAGGGPVWSCGYDDHSLPPVRGGGNQGYHTASLWAVMATLAAVVHRDAGGSGQHIDVSMHAAANVTTEAATYEWLVAGRTVQRQTGRHASVKPTMNVNVIAADGKAITSGVPPRTPEQFRNVLDWLESLDLLSRFDDAVLLEFGTQREGILPLWEVGSDPEVTAIFGAGRQALVLIASHLPAEEFFVEAQRRGLSCGAIVAPEEVLENEHFAARGFPVSLPHPELGSDVVYPGAPFSMSASPWRLYRHAPRLGEHDEEILGPLRAAPRPG